MVLIRRQSACVAKNMQEMQSLKCRRYYVAQMWFLGAIFLLTTTVFAVNAENIELSASPRLAGDDLQVCVIYSFIEIPKIIAIFNRFKIQLAYLLIFMFVFQLRFVLRFNWLLFDLLLSSFVLYVCQLMCVHTHTHTHTQIHRQMIMCVCFLC